MSASYQSLVSYQSPSQVRSKPVTIIPVTIIQVTIIPVTIPVDVSTPLAAVFVESTPLAAVFVESPPLAAVSGLDQIRPTLPGVYLGLKDHSIPAWRAYQASRTTYHVSGNW